jgi:MFS family permease
MGGLWRDPNFLKLWTAQTVSKLGSHIGGTALQFTAILALAATPAQMGLLAGLGAAPVVIIGLLVGVWVDRVRRRPILIAADVGRASLLLSVPAAAALGRLSIGQLYIVAVSVGILTVFFDVADQSFLPVLVRREQLVEGNTKLGIGDSLAEIGGPAAGGGLVQLIGGPAALLFDALSFLVSALCVGLIRAPESVLRVEERQSMRRSIGQGLRLVLGNPLLRALIGSLATFEFFGNFIGTLYALYAIRELHISPGAVGLLVGLGGISALGGAIAAGWAVRRLGLGRALIGSLAGYGGLGVLMPLAHGPVWVAFAFMGVPQLFGDVMIAIFLINEVSVRQGLVPPQLLGRANASMQVVVGALGPAGAVLGGSLGGVIGLRPTLAIGVGGVTAASLWLVFSPIRSLREQPAELPALDAPARP